MASASLATGARPDSAAAPREATYVPSPPIISSSILRWSPSDTAVPVTQSQRKSAGRPCAPAQGCAPRVPHESRARSTLVPGCLLRRPAAPLVKQTTPLSGVNRAQNLAAVGPTVPAAAPKLPVPSTPQQRRPSLHLPVPLPNGVPLRRTTSSCFEHYKILEAIGAGTYANVWKVQRLPVTRYFGSIPLTPAELLSAPGETGLSARLSRCSYTDSCGGPFSAEQDTSHVVPDILPPKTPGKCGASAVCVQDRCQPQFVCDNSAGGVSGTLSSACTSPLYCVGHAGNGSRGPVEGQIYAAKLLQLDKFSADTLPRVLDMFNKEIVNLAACQCPGVVGLREVVEGKEGWLLVQDFVDGGTIWCEDVCRDEDEAFLHFIQVLQAVLYLQEHNILHRDLKPTNILRSKQSRRVIIADFGWSERLDCCHITPMEWPGTLEINPPEIINGTGPLTDRLDNYAVGMALLLFLSGRFVCRQKGLDAATAAPHVLRTVHELRQGPPPAVFKGSGEAWALFIGLTAPHPFRRWSLDQVLAHSWVQQKLQRLRHQAFIWHPRVLQLAVSLQPTYGHSLYKGELGYQRSGRLHVARGSCTTSHVFRSSIESLVKGLPQGYTGGEAPLWTPNKYEDSAVSGVCATAHTVHNRKRLSTAAAAQWTATAAAITTEAPGGQCGSSACARGAYCKQCCRTTGFYPNEWQAVRSWREKHVTYLPHRAHDLPPLNQSGAIPPKTMLSGLSPCAPEPVPFKGLYAERGSGCSRRQSLSICSTTDSFTTVLSFQQQQHASQLSSRGHCCGQTICSPLTPESHAETGPAEGADWQMLLPRSAFKNTDNLDSDGAAAEGDAQTHPSHNGEADADSGEVLFSECTPRQQQICRHLGATTDAAGRQQQYNAFASMEQYQRRRTVDVHSLDPLGVGAGFRSHCQDLLEPVPQFVPCQGEQQIGSLTALQQQRPLPWGLLLAPPVAGLAEPAFQRSPHETGIAVRAAEPSRTNLVISSVEAVCPVEQVASCLQDGSYGSQNAETRKDCDTREQIVDNTPTAAADMERAPAASRRGLKMSSDLQMQLTDSARARLLSGHPCTRQQGRHTHLNAAIEATHGAATGIRGNSDVALLGGTSLENGDAYVVDGSWTPLRSFVLPASLEDPPAEKETGGRRDQEIRKGALRPRRAPTTLPALHSAASASVYNLDAGRSTVQHAWPPSTTASCTQHLTTNLDAVSCSTHHVPAGRISTCSEPTASNSHASACNPPSATLEVNPVAGSCTISPPHHEQSQLQLESAITLGAATGYHALRAPSAAAAVSVGAAETEADSSSVSEAHRCANAHANRRLRGRPHIPEEGRSSTHRAREELKGKVLYAEHSQELSPTLPSSPEDSAIAAAREGERGDGFCSALQRVRRTIPSAEPAAGGVPPFLRSHAMQRLPSQLSAFSSDTGSESPGIPTYRRHSGESVSSKPLQSDGIPAVPLPISSLLVAASQATSAATEKARDLRRGSSSSPALTFPVAARTNTRTTTESPASLLVAVPQRTNANDDTAGTAQDWTSSGAPDIPLHVDTACPVGICSNALEQRDNESDEPTRSSQVGEADVVAAQLLETTATRSVWPAALKRLSHTAATHAPQTAHNDLDTSTTQTLDGEAPPHRPLPQQQERAQFDLRACPDGHELSEQKEVHALVAGVQQESIAPETSVRDKERDQRLGAFAKITCHAKKSQGHDSQEMAKVCSARKGAVVMPTPGTDRAEACGQRATEAAVCGVAGESSELATSPQLMANGEASAENLGDPADLLHCVQSTCSVVDSADSLQAVDRQSESAAVLDLPSVAGIDTRFATVPTDARQSAPSRRLESGDFLREEANCSKQAARCKNMRITGRIEYHGKCQPWRGEDRSCPFPAHESGGRVKPHRPQSSVPAKSVNPGKTGRQLPRLRVIDDAAPENLSGCCAQPGLSIRRSRSPSPTQSAQDALGASLRSLSPVQLRLRLEGPRDSHKAPGEGDEYTDTTRATTGETYQGASVKKTFVAPSEQGTDSSQTRAPGRMAEGNDQTLREGAGSDMLSSTPAPSGQVSVIFRGATTQSAQLQRTEQLEQLSERDIFQHAAPAGYITKHQRNSQSGTSLTVAWRRAGSFPGALTPTPARKTSTGQYGFLLFREDRVSSCGPLEDNCDDSCSAALPTYDFRSEPVWSDTEFPSFERTEYHTAMC